MVHHSYMFEKVYASDNDDDNDSLTLREKCPNTEFLLVRISHIRNEYGEILRISPYSFRMWENTDQKKLPIWTLFVQWKLIIQNQKGKMLLISLLSTSRI